MALTNVGSMGAGNGEGDREERLDHGSGCLLYGKFEWLEGLVSGAFHGPWHLSHFSRTRSNSILLFLSGRFEKCFWRYPVGGQGKSVTNRGALDRRVARGFSALTTDRKPSAQTI